MTYNLWIGADPSVNHGGWSILTGPHNPKIMASGVHKFYSKQGSARYCMIADQLQQDIAPWIQRDGVRAIGIIERASFQDTKNGLLLARQKNLPTLCSACAVFLTQIYMMGADVAYVSASQWKMKSPKPMIQAQCEKIFPQKTGNWASEDEMEAVALSLWGMMRHGQGVYEIYKHERG